MIGGVEDDEVCGDGVEGVMRGDIAAEARLGVPGVAIAGA